MTSLPEHLRALLAKLRVMLDADLPDPDSLDHSGEVEARGQVFTAKSSVLLNDLEGEDKYTVYLHTAPSHEDGSSDDSSSMMASPERLRYFDFDNRREMTGIFIQLASVEGQVQQSIKVSTVPREIFIQMVNRNLGRGGGGRKKFGRADRPQMGGDRDRPRPRPGAPWRPRPMKVNDDNDDSSSVADDNNDMSSSSSNMPEEDEE